MKWTNAECGDHAKGMLTARGSGIGSDFQRRSPAGTVRGPAWTLIGQAYGVTVDRSNAEGGVMRGVAGRVIEPGQS